MFKHIWFNPNKHRNKKQTKHKHTLSSHSHLPNNNKARINTIIVVI